MAWLRNFGYVIASAALLIILTLILFPIHIGDERISGKTTACLSNLKQLSTSLIMYMGDYDERMPTANSWCDSIKVYKRPNSTLSCTDLPPSWEADQNPSKDGLGYAMNAFLSDANARRFEEPANTYMLYESSTIGKNVSEFFPRFPVPSRHQGKYIVAFLDGHARAFQGAPRFANFRCREGTASRPPSVRETSLESRAGSNPSRCASKAPPKPFSSSTCSTGLFGFRTSKT